MKQLTEHDVVRFADRLFAWGQGYNVPTPFANRETAVSVLLKALEKAEAANDQRIVCVYDTLGSGKTFLVNNVLSRAKAASVRVRFASEALAQDLATLNPAPFQRLQIVDELDIKADPSVWEISLDAIAGHSAQTGGTLLLIGDATLKCDYVRDRLEEIAPTEYLGLEPLTQPFFELALATRVKSCFALDGVEPFIDPDFLNALIPPWSVSAATFRSTFQVLAQIAQQMIGTDRPCRLGRPQLVRWLETKRFPTNRRVREAARQIVGHVQGLGSAVEPLSDDMLGSILALKPCSSDYVSVVKSLVSYSVLFSLGVPVLSSDGGYDRWRGPYVPGERACLEAFAVA